MFYFEWIVINEFLEKKKHSETLTIPNPFHEILKNSTLNLNVKFYIFKLTLIKHPIIDEFIKLLSILRNFNKESFFQDINRSPGMGIYILEKL